MAEHHFTRPAEVILCLLGHVSRQLRLPESYAKTFIDRYDVLDAQNDYWRSFFLDLLFATSLDMAQLNTPKVWRN